MSEEIKKGLLLSLGNKSLVVALLLWLFFGIVGVHRMYLQHATSGVIMAIFTVLGLLTLTVAIGFIFLFIVLLWWILDFIMLLLAAKKPPRIHDEMLSE